MYSLNIPLPPPVRDLLRKFRPHLTGFESVRPSRSATLVLKRLDADDRREYLRAERDATAALQGTPAVEARIADVGIFDPPVRGSGPIAYLAVESPGLRQVHESLVADLGGIEGLEGDDYTPHVTLARDGPPRAVERVRDVDFDPVTWTIDEIEFYDATHSERIDAIRLPA